jgi:hypothetical protein
MFDFSDKSTAEYQNFIRYVDTKTNRPFSIKYLKKHLHTYEYGYAPKFEEITFKGVEQENFLSAEECDYLINRAKTKNAWLTKKQTFGFWEDRNTPLLCESMLSDDQDSKYKKLVIDIHDRLRDLFSKQLADGENVYCDQIGIVRWEPGSYQMTHIDHVDGMDRICGSVIYLNDDYSGGETFYPFFEKSMIPQKGKVFAHDPDNNHLHGVTQIGGCTRYTISSTWGTNIKWNTVEPVISRIRQSAKIPFGEC